MQSSLTILRPRAPAVPVLSAVVEPGVTFSSRASKKVVARFQGNRHAPLNMFTEHEFPATSARVLRDVEAVSGAVKAAQEGETCPPVLEALESFERRCAALRRKVEGLHNDVCVRGFFTHARGQSLADARHEVRDLVSDLNGTDFDAIASKYEAAQAKRAAERAAENDRAARPVWNYGAASHRRYTDDDAGSLSAHEQKYNLDK